MRSATTIACKLGADAILDIENRHDFASDERHVALRNFRGAAKSSSIVRTRRLQAPVCSASSRLDGVAWVTSCAANVRQSSLHSASDCAS